MAQSNCKFFLVSLSLLLFTSACDRTSIETAPSVVDDNLPTAKIDTEKKTPSSIAAIPTPTDILPPAAGQPVDLPPPGPPPFLGAGFSGGGGGGRNVRNDTSVGQLTCENHTSDCNDHNPCTVDACNDLDQCEHSLDLTKSEFASCEVDGDACTVGKCMLAIDEVICHEERREFLEGELGCKDSNDCTADSCITKSLGDKNDIVQFDSIGNVILDNEYQCLSEVITGIACFAENECVFGMCTSSGTGSSTDPFAVACVASNVDNQPQAYCPESPENAGNPCNMAVCTVGIGCQVVEVPDNTPCDDGNTCTAGDVCLDGVCSGGGIDCDDGVACTRDICDGTGSCSNIPDNSQCPSTGAQCQVNVCDATEGCQLADAGIGALCSDGDPCTIEDTCDAEGNCAAGGSVSCSDTNLNDCQVATCVAGQGCSLVPAQPGSACIDSDPCFVNDTCNDEGDCAAGDTPLICADPDRNDCVVFTCETGVGCNTIDFVAESSPCVDDNPCTLNDTCNGEGGCEPGLTPLICADDDVNDCQIPSCTSGLGCGFTNAEEGTSCLADASVCTMDMCNASGECVLGTAIACADDGDPCTAQMCDEKFGCIYPAGNDDAACDDNNACTTNTTCSEGSCNGGTDVDCNDDNACTLDLCDAINGCYATNLNGPVGNACTLLGDVYGICAQGFTVCEDGVENSDLCVPFVTPGSRLEICGNGIDEDCDGDTDEEDCICDDTPGATTYYVTALGDDSADCLSLGTACATIQAAITKASPGDGIFVSGVVSQGGITVNKNLSIVGQGIDSTVIVGSGGAIFITEAVVSICGVTLTNGGPGLYNTGTTTLFNSHVLNSNFTNGGGIFNLSTGTLTVGNSIISNNTATDGAGIYNLGNLTVKSSVIRDNNAGQFLQSGFGGGIYSSNVATLNLSKTTVRNNTAGVEGGGILNQSIATITQSTINNNLAFSGGGISNTSTLSLVNSTISTNQANIGFGGGIYNNQVSAALTISNSTFSNNSATVSQGGGIYNFNGIISASHSIVANSTGGDCGAAIANDIGFNLDEDNSCGFATSPVDPNLGPLANNGGSTFTHAIISPSPALDTGSTSCGVTEDQRGEPRPVDYASNSGNALCDIGAFELQN